MSIESRVRETISELTGKDVMSIDAGVDLVDYLALDSIDGLRVVAGIERKLDVRFPDDVLGKLHTIEGIVQVIKKET